MTQRVEGGLTYTQTFDAENRLVSVTVSGQTTQFVYDGDGNLVKKIKPDGSKTIYVGGIYEVDKTSGGAVTRTVTYYPAAGAMRIDSAVYYTLKDHLGSASVVTNASGGIVGEQRYAPYGETRVTSGSMYTDRLFTSQREMAGLGIYYFRTLASGAGAGADNGPIKHFLLKFDVTGVNRQMVTNAKIRLYNVNAASQGGVPFCNET